MYTIEESKGHMKS